MFQRCTLSLRSVLYQRYVWRCNGMLPHLSLFTLGSKRFLSVLTESLCWEFEECVCKTNISSGCWKSAPGEFIVISNISFRWMWFCLHCTHLAFSVFLFIRFSSRLFFHFLFFFYLNPFQNFGRNLFWIPKRKKWKIRS